MPGGDARERADDDEEVARHEAWTSERRRAPATSQGRADSRPFHSGTSMTAKKIGITRSRPKRPGSGTSAPAEKPARVASDPDDPEGDAAAEQHADIAAALVVVARAEEPARIGEEEEIERGARQRLAAKPGLERRARAGSCGELTTAVTAMIVRIVAGVQTSCQISSATIWDGAGIDEGAHPERLRRATGPSGPPPRRRPSRTR